MQDSVQGKSEGLTPTEQNTFIANIVSDTQRLEAMAQRLRELAHAESLPQNECTELAPVIADLRSRFPASSIEASGSLDRAIGMSGEKALLHPSVSWSGMIYSENRFTLFRIMPRSRRPRRRRWRRW
nr:hypothetical protein [Bradyrhizobium sp. UNPA324]